MERNILITGGNSDIGKALINDIISTENVNIFSTRHKGESLKDIVDHEYDVDFSSDISSFLLDIKNNSLTDLVIIHGHIEREDSLLKNTAKNNLLQINLNSVIQIVHELLPSMIANKYGRIIFIGTASVEHGGGENSFTYGLSKSGLLYLARHLGKFYTKYNILSNCVSPGYVDTKFQQKAKCNQEIKERLKSIPIGRGANAQEVAATVEFLLFNNNYITGQNIVVDAGDFL